MFKVGAVNQPLLIHNPKVGGSTPPPATKYFPNQLNRTTWLTLRCGVLLAASRETVY